MSYPIDTEPHGNPQWLDAVNFVATMPKLHRRVIALVIWGLLLVLVPRFQNIIWGLLGAWAIPGAIEGTALIVLWSAALAGRVRLNDPPTGVESAVAHVLIELGIVGLTLFFAGSHYAWWSPLVVSASVLLYIALWPIGLVFTRFVGTRLGGFV